MSFLPSPFSLAALTVSSTASARGMSNQPSSADHIRNLGKLKSFLSTIPFVLRINSAYRSPAVNQVVSGTPTGQHPNGLAADVTPRTMSNRTLATWLWLHREEYPELDQVIWYTDTSHVHIGICPAGAVGCPRPRTPRQQFLRKGSEGSGYTAWAPDSAEQQAVARQFPQGRPLSAWVWLLGGATVVAAAGGAFWWFRLRD